MSSTIRCSTRAAALAVALGFAVTLAPGSAIAAPATAAEAARAVAVTARQVEALGEQVNDLQLAAGEQQALADAADRAADVADTAVAALLPRVNAIVVRRFVGGAPSGLQAILSSSSPEDLASGLTLLEQIARKTDATVAELVDARASAVRARTAADAAAATAAEAVAEVQGRQDQLEADLTGYRAAFARLSATEQARVITAVAGPDMPASQTAATAELAPAAAPSEAAATAVRTALAQVGKPYVTGAAGPNGFDCSGLTQFAYAAAGISLPHSSRSQSGLGAAVSRGDLQPGDLVFFYSPVSHVGLYIGNGQMVHASVTGRPVLVTSVDKPGYVGGRRPTA